jgi:MFS family permease
MNSESPEKIGWKNWSALWAIGLTGQLLWNVENAIFNTFAYRTAAHDAPLVIQWMVALSAIATTVSTLVMGTWCDGTGKRRPFIAAGYALWGVLTIAFGSAGFLPVALVGAGLVIADSAMSFAGSIGFDAGFGAWTTDISNDRNRGALCGALAVMPILATIVGTAGFGVLIDGVKGTPFSGIGYFPFFILIGIVVIAVGALSLAIVRDSPTLKPNRNGSFSSRFLSAFSLKGCARKAELFAVFVTLAVYFIAFYVFFPFILPYLEHTLGLGLGLAGIIMGGGLALSAVLVVPAASFINRGRHVAVTACASLLTAIGLAVFSTGSASSVPNLLVGMFLAGGGYILVLQALNTWLKNLYPETGRSQFEGIRLVFFVCIPMVVGPAIGTPLVTGFGTTLSIEGKAQALPTELLFRVSAVLVLFTLIPLFFAVKSRKRAIGTD